MIKRFYTLGFLLFIVPVLQAQITLERCVTLAQENYPLIKKYELLDRTRGIGLSDINKSWLPQIGVYGQVTAQNVVPSYPDALSDVLDRMGTKVEGLGKIQYKVGIDINQTVWDGGIAASRREVANAEDAERRAALDVQMYEIRQRVESLFFGILLVDEQIRQAQATQALLESNLSRVRALKDNGVAMQSDVDMVEANCLAISQQLIQARSASRSYRRMLGLFVDAPLETEVLEMPVVCHFDELSANRPEQALFDARIKVNDARRAVIRSAVMPKVGLFAQGYYGYPGLDYFKSMMGREWSWNIFAGVKVSWNIGAFYTKKNDERRLQLSTQGVLADRELFLFNTRMSARSQSDRIAEIEDVMKEDSRIVELRASVRRAAEAQLENGVIDATALLSKITDENQARLTSAYHEIQLLQSIYQLKYTLNR